MHLFDIIPQTNLNLPLTVQQDKLLCFYSNLIFHIVNAQNLKS